MKRNGVESAFGTKKKHFFKKQLGIESSSKDLRSAD
jgi:hypothetical protein